MSPNVQAAWCAHRKSNNISIEEPVPSFKIQSLSYLLSLPRSKFRGVTRINLLSSLYWNCDFEENKDIQALNNFWKSDASYTLYYVGYNTTKDATNMAGGPTNTTYGPTNATCGPTNTRGGSTCLLTQQVASPKPQVALLTQYLALPTQMVALLTQQVVWAAPQVALQIR